jgi:hypothetical protein
MHSIPNRETMNNYSRIQNHGLALLLSHLGVGPDTHPGELPPTELMLLGALSVRDAQLANAVDTVDAVVQTLNETSRKLAFSNLQAKVFFNISHQVSRELEQERQARYDAEDRASEAEDRLGDLKIRLQGLSDAAKDLHDEVEDALDEAEDGAPVSTDPYSPPSHDYRDFPR